MVFYVSNKIVVVDYDKRLLDWCKENLVLNNPEFAKKERMGVWLGNTPRKIYLYEKDGSNIVIPFGCINDLRKNFPEYRFLSRICPIEDFKCDSSISLYDYQEKAVKAGIMTKNGVIVMPCGSGKTQVGLEIIARLKTKTLWLTHTQDLLNQSMSRAKSVLECDPKSYGTITGGKVNIGSGITFATVQTMAKLDLSQYKDTWGCVVVDECHKAVGSPTKVMQFYKVLSNVSCRYKFGLTATPKRADGLERSMFALLGNIVCEIGREAVADTTCPVKVQTVHTEYTPDLNIALSGDGTINYAGLVDDLTHNPKRFECVSNVLETLDGATLVLANRVEYLERLKKEYDKRKGGFEPSICLSSLGQSKKAKEYRKRVLQALNEGEIDCVFATYQLAKEGLDVPNLQYVVFATPEKDPTTIQQAAGRVGRKAEGKEYGTVIDFVDSNFGMFSGWRKKRESVYRKMDYEIIY